jgi:DNA-binding GntR family transcriptional regulator
MNLAMRRRAEQPAGLADSTYEQIRRAILDGTYPPGAVLNETQLAASLGVSKTPIHYALLRLRDEALLEVGPRRQLAVRRFGPDNLFEIIHVREALERIALARACEVMGLDDIDQLRLNVLRQKRAAEANRQEEFDALDEEFHLRIAAGAQFDLVGQILRMIRGSVVIMRIRARRNLMIAYREHLDILDALEARDTQRALDALAIHLKNALLAWDESDASTSGKSRAADTGVTRTTRKSLDSPESAQERAGIPRPTRGKTYQGAP